MSEIDIIITERDRGALTSVLTCQPDGQFGTWAASEHWNYSIEEAEAWRPPWYNDVPEVPTSTYVQDGELMNDRVVHQYNRLVREKVLLPVNPMWKEFRLLSSYAAGYADYRKITTWSNGGKTLYSVAWFRWTYYRRPGLSNALPISRTWPTADWDSMSIKARAQVAKGFMDYLTSISELHKTIDLVVGFKKRVIKQLKGLVRGWKRKHWKGWKKINFFKFMDSISSYYLEYRYGWRLLYYDYVSLKKVLETDHEERIFRSFRVTEELASETKQSQGSWNPFNWNEVTTRSVTARAGCTGVLDSRTRGMSIDPLTTAFELLPLSFVLDMFWNIGDNIAALSPFTIVREKNLWRSFETERETFVEITPKSSFNGYDLVQYYDLSVGHGTCVHSYKEREPLPESGFTMTPEIPTDYRKWLDLGSLAVVLRGIYLDLFRR